MNRKQTQKFIEAVARGNLVEIRRLIEGGADVNANALREGTADPDFNEYSYPRVAETPLTAACREGQEEVTRMLLDSGANPNFPRQDGVTALMNACEKGHMSVVKLLSDRGPDSLHKDSCGDIALDKAISENHRNVVQLILEKTEVAHRDSKYR